MSRSRAAEIALVGMGCRFAGSGDLVTYFENIVAARDCTREVPADRWDPAVFFDPHSPAADRVPCCRGGYLDSPLRFDAAAHGIMPRTALGGEPEQFLVLETAMAALADAGLTTRDVASSRVQIVIGRGNYFNRGNLTRLQHGRMIAETIALLSALHPEWSELERQAVRADLRSSLPPFEAATIPGQLTNATASRLAHRLDAKGASFVVDAASASSLVALNLAMMALLNKQSDLAIAAGVYLEADVDFPLVFRQLNALSPSGTARPFSSSADGMLPGEGAGVVILKRRADAERDGDRIYALVQAVGVCSDGRSPGLAVPSARGHARAIRQAFRRSGIDPATVMLVEGHGLGVPAADRAELRALNSVFPAPLHGKRHLGAVSSMIGHAMPAAGMAGLIKVALALHHRVLPPTLHADKPHPLLDRPDSAFALNPSARPWIHASSEYPRRAGVSAFGLAGVNAHAVLEEHAASADGPSARALRGWDTEAILLSAPDRAGLIKTVRELIDRLPRRSGEPLLNVAYTLNSACRDRQGPVRLGLVASSVADLSQQLTVVLERLGDPAGRSIRDGRGIYYWDDPIAGGTGKLAFLFPGEGSQYPGMLADLCFHFPEVRRLFDTADRIALELGDPVPPSEHLFAPESAGGEELWTSATAVNVVLNAQWALYGVLSRLRMTPDAVAGHSSGEFLALAAAGVFATDRALEQKLARLGAIFRGFESSGDLPEAHLVAIAAPRDRAEALCRDAGAEQSVLAMDNCPHQVVLAVPPSEFEQLTGRLRSENILWEDLPFARAYHTPSFGPVVGPIADFFAGMPFEPPTIPIYSCASRSRMPNRVESVRELAVAQWTQTVAFRETVEAMHSDGLRVFVDVGARGNLAGFVEDTLRGKPAFAIAANLPRRGGLTQLNHLVAALFAQGVSLSTDYLYARRRPDFIDWDGPQPAPRATVELKIGFPAMRLSDQLVDQLSAVRRSAAASRAHDLDGDSYRQAYSADRTQHVVPDHNGARDPEHSATEAAAVSAEATKRVEGIEEVSPGLFDGSYSNGHANDALLTEAFTALSDASPAMLSFQHTMRVFLRTQQEVMSSYLGTICSQPSVSPACASALLHTEDNGDGAPHRASLAPALAGGTGVLAVQQSGSPRSAQAVLDASAPHTENVRSIAAVEQEPFVARSTSGSDRVAGPWVGDVRRLVPGSEIDTLLVIDHRDDPIAEHHTLGGRLISALDPSLRGLPVLPFAVMAEMTAEVAALAFPPELVLTGLEQVKARRWVRYEEEPVHLEIRGRRVEGDGDLRMRVGIFNRGPGGKTDARRPVFDAVAVFNTTTLDSRAPAAWSLEKHRPSRFTSESVYAEHWLFHGPAFQAISHVGELGANGIEGTIRVLPWEPLVRPGQLPHFHIDLIVLDTFTQLLGCWGLDYLDEGDVVFPLSMNEFAIYGDRPLVGTDVCCRITIDELELHRARVSAEIIRPDGTVWMRILDWQDWRFHWPGRYRDGFRQPRDYFVGEEIVLPEPWRSKNSPICAVWLEPPADMGRPVWRDVLEYTQLGPAERAQLLATASSDPRRTHRLWGKIAAKEAARRLWLADGRRATYPADLAIDNDDQGRPRLVLLEDPENKSLPAISVAHCDGIAVALAAADPAARPGIAVETISERPEGFEDLAFTPQEQSLLDQSPDSSRRAWIARFWCAKEAAAKAAGSGLDSTARTAEVTSVDFASGVMHVRVAPSLSAEHLGSFVNPIRVHSNRRGDYAWAWTLGEGA
jgi:acyl transferase domain-containing protein/phosphopantetheinyl transferase (holo-ACP synthase)